MKPSLACSLTSLIWVFVLMVACRHDMGRPPLDPLRVPITDLEGGGAVAEVAIVRHRSGLGAHPHPASLDDLRRFREVFYDCLLARADALFEVTDALLCVEGAVTSLVELTLTAEHRRGHGALYDGLNCGRLDTDRLP